LGYLGYVVMLLEIVGITRLFHDGADVFQVGMLLAFYGLYFGVLSRDIADLCSDTIAQNLGVSPRVHTRRPGRRECADQLTDIRLPGCDARRSTTAKRVSPAAPRTRPRASSAATRTPASLVWPTRPTRPVLSSRPSAWNAAMCTA